MSFAPKDGTITISDIPKTVGNHKPNTVLQLEQTLFITLSDDQRLQIVNNRQPSNKLSMLYLLCKVEEYSPVLQFSPIHAVSQC